MNKIFKEGRNIALTFLLAELFLLNLAAQDCDNILKDGVFNATSISASSDLNRVFNQYIYASDFSSHQQAIDAGLSVGTMVYGVPLQIGGTFSKQEKDEWRKTHQEFKSESLTTADKYSALLKFASPEILEAWTTCIQNVSSTKVGLNGWIQEVSSSSAILHLTWLPMAGDGGEAPKVTGSSITGGFRSDNSAGPILPVNYTFLQGANGNLVSLVRVPNKPLVLVVNTTRGDVACALKGFPKPTILSFTASPSAVKETESSSLVWSISKSDQVTIDNGIGDVQANGSVNVTPRTTTTYKLTASNRSGSVSTFVTVNVTPLPPPPPVLASASVSFYTTDNDKDDDTRVSVYIKAAGNTVAQWSGTEGHWDDNSGHGPYGLQIVEQIQKGQLIGPGQAVLVEAPHGHDEWHFNWTLVLAFSDGSTKQYNWGGNVDYDRTTLSNPLP